MTFQLGDDTVTELARQIFDDYQTAATDPTERDRQREKNVFDAVGLPEKPVIKRISEDSAFDERDLANYLTLTAVVNYKKETSGPTGIWAATYGLLKHEPWLFKPEQVAERGEDAVHAVFQDVPVMNLEDEGIYAYEFPDVEIWVNNATSLAEQYNSDPRELLEQQDYNAYELQQYIDDVRDFPFLGGDKINPLWLRLMHEEIHELSRIKEISIPVDTRIRSLTGHLQANDSMGNEQIRDYWDDICAETDLIPVRLDQPLWILGKYWESIGQAYVIDTLDEMS